MKHIQIWTDGSCNNKEGDRFGAAACVMKYGRSFRAITQSAENTSSGAMELVAISLAVKSICDKMTQSKQTFPKYHIEIFSDSEYAISVCDGSKVAEKNRELVAVIRETIRIFNENESIVKFTHIKGDSHPYNRLVHDLANSLRFAHKHQDECIIMESKAKRH